MTTDQRGSVRPVDYASVPDATVGDGGDIAAAEVWPAAPQLSILPARTNVLLLWSITHLIFDCKAPRMACQLSHGRQWQARGELSAANSASLTQPALISW